MAIHACHANITYKLKCLLKLLFYIFCICISTISLAQQKKQGFIKVSGNVYDISARQPIEAVAVLTTSGMGTLTDSLGKYEITVRWTDSIWFSMLGKTTIKFPVDTISNVEEFNVMIHVRVSELPEVKVRSKNYKLDSTENRKEYAKYFNYKKPSLVLLDNRTYSPGSVSVGFDLQEIINMFRFKRNRSLAAMQKRLIQQEQDKYIDYRFNKSFTRKLTKLPQLQLDSFMNEYRPDYEFLKTVNEIEFGYYIQKCFDEYKKNKQQKKYFYRKPD